MKKPLQKNLKAIVVAAVVVLVAIVDARLRVEAVVDFCFDLKQLCGGQCLCTITRSDRIG